jgi:pilus assembly protein CpaF
MIDIAFAHELENLVEALPVEEFGFGGPKHQQGRELRIERLIEDKIRTFPETQRKRIHAEFLGLGPIDEILEDPMVTEILILGPEFIYIEKNGQLNSYGDCFSTRQVYQNFIERLCSIIGHYLTKEIPTVSGNFNGSRVQIISQEITKSFDQVSIRRHPLSPWNLQSLLDEGFCLLPQAETIRKMIQEKNNFMIVGGTGTGKTSLINACLQETTACERSIVIEDTPEICLPNGSCSKLLTRVDPQKILPEITQADLIRHALRLRPDRIVMGEVRGGEAKDFLMALSTGHQGSFGSLHANSAAQALIRLEMLVQLGAPNWNIGAIRRIIQMSLQAIIVIGKSASGKRFIEGIFRLSSLEEFGFSIEPY